MNFDIISVHANIAFTINDANNKLMISIIETIP